MRRKIAITFSLLLVFALNTFAQSKIILDENMKLIDSVQFKKKCKSQILKCFSYTADSLFLKKVLYKYRFGKLSKEENSQLRKIFIQNTNKQIKQNANIIINFRDTLYNFITRKKAYDVHIKNHDSVHHISLTTKKFNSQRKRWIKSQKKCSKKVLNKFNTSVFYVYKYDTGSIKDYPDLNWIKDRGIFKTKFFNIQYNYKYVLLKPNGDYFLCGGHLSDKDLKLLLKKNDWSTFKNDWEKSYDSKSKKGVGFFKIKSHQYNEKHCY